MTERLHFHSSLPCIGDSQVLGLPKELVLSDYIISGHVLENCSLERYTKATAKLKTPLEIMPLPHLPPVSHTHTHTINSTPIMEELFYF